MLEIEAAFAEGIKEDEDWFVKAVEVTVVDWVNVSVSVTTLITVFVAVAVIPELAVELDSLVTAGEDCVETPIRYPTKPERTIKTIMRRV